MVSPRLCSSYSMLVPTPDLSRAQEAVLRDSAPGIVAAERDRLIQAIGGGAVFSYISFAHNYSYSTLAHY